MASRTEGLPTALLARSRWERLGPAGVPALLVHPQADRATHVPLVVWMHGRTARKEIDPGRYLRLMRTGIGVCALDLPGHGERFDAALQDPRHTLDLILQMADEVDDVVGAALEHGGFDETRLALGGMSAGGMASLVRLCRAHPFRCTSVEAASGSWRHQAHREMFLGRGEDEIAARDPIRNLAGWREIPVQAIHARHDAWVGIEGQEAFLNALRERYADPALVEMVIYDRTGAPFEHAGFGRFASVAKNAQRDFLRRAFDLPDLG